MARNWMGDYDPGNTTGWKNTGQVETRTPSGGTKTSFDPNPDTNPSYNPKAPRANPIESKEKYLKQNLNLKYANKFKKNPYSFFKNPIKKHNTGSTNRSLKWAKKQEYEKIMGLMKMGLTQKEVEDLMRQENLTGSELSIKFGTGKKYIEELANLKTKTAKGQPLGTKYLSTTPSVDSRIKLPGWLSMIQGDVNSNNVLSSLNKLGQINTMVDEGITQADITDYYDKSMGRGKYDIFGGGGNGDGPQPLIPINYNTGAGTTEDVVEDETFEYHLGKGGQKTGKDVTDPRGYAANGGIMGLRARKAFGGIMDRVTGRKAYGLGSIFKSVKKAVGKVLKSDIGKMAIAGAAIYYGGGGGMPKMFGGSGVGGFSPTTFFSKGNPLLFSSKMVDGVSKQVFSPWKLAAMTVGTGAAMGPAKVDQLPGAGNRGGHLIDPITGKEALPSQMRASLNNALDNADGDPIRIKQINDAYAFLGPDERLGTYLPYRTYGVKDGGRIGKAEGGLMDLGGMEKDYRAEGGFVPIGAKEKADDVPARLSVNEFVFTADAVRNAGGGDIDQGAEVMENVMKNLEAGGKISAETQGNTGAQEMFSVSERLGEVL